MRLSVLIPAYNEANTILDVICKVKAVDLEKEIVVVDDFSTDGTRQLLKAGFGNGKSDVKIVYHTRNRGKGAAIKTALECAKGDYAIIQDADLEYDPIDYRALLGTALETGAAAVFGSRFLKTWRVTTIWHFLVNRTLTVLTNLLFGSSLTDMETCYKMIRTDIFKELDIKSERFEVEAEITAKLLKANVKILEVPISYKGRSYHEGKKITWTDGISTVLALLRYRFLK